MSSYYDNLDYDLISKLCSSENFDENTFLAIVRSADKYRHLKNRSQSINSIESKLTRQKLILRK